MNARHARAEAHKVFDRLWKDGHMTRTEAYHWLAKQFPDGIAHIREMDAVDCERLMRAVRRVIPIPHSR